jgi:ribosome maturation factor RimP
MAAARNKQHLLEVPIVQGRALTPLPFCGKGGPTFSMSRPGPPGRLAKVGAVWPAFFIFSRKEAQLGRKEDILEKVRGIAAPLASAEGLELVDVELAGAAGHPTLRLYIDKEGGVSLEDCTAVSRAVSAALDVEDPIESRYELEVSSPGLDRPLRTPEHFVQFAGQSVRIKTYGPVAEAGNRKTFVGKLVGFEDGRVAVEVDGTVYRVPRDQIAKANVEPTFADLKDREERNEGVLTIDGRHVAARGKAVKTVLKELRGRDAAEVWARREDGALCALVARDDAVLLLDDEEGRPAYTSRGRKPDSAKLSFRRATGELEEYPASWAVPAADAVRAVEHYLLHGQRPSFIHWHEEKPGH